MGQVVTPSSAIMGPFLTSLDLANWNTNMPERFIPFLGVTYGKDRFVAVGDNTTILASPEGVLDHDRIR